MPETPQYAIWTPKFDGDAPPNWTDEMAWGIRYKPEVTEMPPFWTKGEDYRVPLEALATPFDYPTWAAQGRANADKLPDMVAEALGPERDWADDLVRELWPLMSAFAAIGAAKVLRSRCRPINDTVTDEWLDDALARIFAAWTIGKSPIDDNGYSARKTLRNIIAEATQ